MIEIRNLAKTYHGAEGDFTAVKNINLTINDGDIFGIIGLSGAGKSTLVRCINLLEVPTEGDVLVDGRYEAAKRDAAIGMATVYRMVSTLEEIGVFSRCYRYSLPDRPWGEEQAGD